MDEDDRTKLRLIVIDFMVWKNRAIGICYDSEYCHGTLIGTNPEKLTLV